MLKTTLEVICDHCEAAIIVPSVFSSRKDTRPEWEFNPFCEEYRGNVIIHDVEQWLEDAGWLVDLEGEIPLIKCPVCKEIEDDD